MDEDELERSLCNGRYIIDDKGKVVPCENLMQWAQWLETEEGVLGRKVERTQVGYYEVSTVFLSLDHNYTGRGKPVLWESLVFCDDEDGDRTTSSDDDEDVGQCRRYTGLLDAKNGHWEMVDHLRKKLIDAGYSPIEKIMNPDYKEEGE